MRSGPVTVETAGRSALTAAGALIGGGLGAALGTSIFPGAGTAVGYLFDAYIIFR